MRNLGYLLLGQSFGGIVTKASHLLSWKIDFLEKV
jgi:hypothetical protein